MNLSLTRRPSTGDCTHGELAIDGSFECYTLEDVVRPEKVPGETAIPAGKYEVVITFSDRFQRMMPLLLGVPQFSGVRIHPGNRAANTEGCILVGRTCGNGSIGESRLAYDALFAKLETAAKREKIYIEIV